MGETGTGALHDYLERICNLLRAQARAAGAEFGLQPVQMEALRYLAMCNRYSDTPQAVAQYLGLTKGTVSQTLKVLEARGLVEKVPEPDDRRVVHLVVTTAGRATLDQALPVPLLQRAAEALPQAQREGLVDELRRLLRTLQASNGLNTFGVCASCRFNERTAAGHRCGLTGELLTLSDIERICREHQYPSDSIAEG
jgi:DNA-binding MarR family transcriptional regulator